MKVAWLVSGNIRNLVEIHDSWENNFFKYYDVDVYFHLWSYADFAEKGDAFFPDCCTYEEAVDLYNPKRHEKECISTIECFRARNFSNMAPETRVFNVLSMWDKWKKSFAFLDPNSSYDVIFRTSCFK